MRKIYYHKLIRDKLPETIRGYARGADCETRTLSPKEFEKELIKKVAEEAGGLAAAKGRAQLTDELADILAAIDELKKVKKISTAEMRRAQAANLKKKGGFKKRLFLIWSSDTRYRTNEPKGKSPK